MSPWRNLHEVLLGPKGGHVNEDGDKMLLALASQVASLSEVSGTNYRMGSVHPYFQN